MVLGDVDHWRDYHHRMGAGTTRRNWLELMPSTVLMGFMKEFDFHGPSMNLTAMCASGVVGLLTAQMWINAGIATDVIVIASDVSVTPENARSFGNLGVLHIDAPPWDVCRPFQEGSRGFNPGEASVAMVVSGRPQAAYARVLGGAMSSDGYHPVSIAPDYAQVRRAFTGALDQRRRPRQRHRLSERPRHRHRPVRRRGERPLRRAPPRGRGHLLHEAIGGPHPGRLRRASRS